MLNTFKLWAIYCISLVLLSQTGQAQAKEEEPIVQGPATVTLGSNLAQIKLPSGYKFVTEKVAKEVLSEQGDSTEGVLGLVLPTQDDESERWVIICTYSDIGYVSDKDAEQIDAKALLDQIREATNEHNEELKERKIAPIFVSGWNEKPHYQKSSHQVIWAIDAKDEDKETAPITITNYNTRILGRKGVLSMNLVTLPDDLSKDKSKVSAILANTSYTKGNRYEDFVPGTDKDAGIGLAGLILGGGAAAAAAKMGVFGVVWKWLLGIILVGKKFAILIIAAIGGAIAKLFKKNKGQAS